MTRYAAHHPHFAQPAPMLRTPALVSLAAALQLACRQTRTASPWSERGAGGDLPRLRRLLLQAGVLLLHGLAIWGD